MYWRVVNVELFSLGKQIASVTLAYVFFIFTLVIWSVYYVAIVRRLPWWSLLRGSGTKTNQDSLCLVVT